MPKRKAQKSVQRGIAKANVSLKSIAAVLDQQTQTIQQIQDSSSQVQDDKGGGGSAQLIAIQIARAQLAFQKESNDHLKKIQASSNKQIEALQKSNKDWKGFGDKFKDFKGKMSDAFDINTIKKKLLGPFSMFKGARDKMEDLDYMKRAKALGRTDTKQIKADAVASRTAKEDALRAQDKIDRLKRLGANQDQINGSDAMQQRTSAMNTYNSLNGSPSSKSARDAANPMGGNVAFKSSPLVQTPSDSGQVSQSTTDKLAEQQAAHENQIEQLKNLQAQTDLLQQIATNTALAAGKKSSSAGGAEDSGQSASGRALNGISSAFSGIGDAMGSMGQGVGRGIGGLIGGVFSGIMQGIADGIAAFGTMKTVKGIAAIGLLTGVMYGMVQVFDSFSQLDWDSVNKGLLTIGAVVVAAGVIGKFVDKVALGAAAIGLLGASLWVVGQAFQSIGDGFQTMNDGLTQLSQLDGRNLFTVAGGIAAIGASLAAFGAGSVAAGLGTLIGNLLTVGQDSPIAQLQQLSNMGDDLNKASQGIDSIGKAMVGFSKIDKGAIDALNDFPWVRATAFVAAGGAMNVDGAKVYATSKSNADTSSQVDASNARAAAGGGNVTQTQVNNNTTQNNNVKSSARNSESSYAKYLSARY